jgi:hypothetical protein
MTEVVFSEEALQALQGKVVVLTGRYMPSVLPLLSPSLTYNFNHQVVRKV